MPHGESTILDEAGAGLSGGERRRLGLARALLKPSSLYVFDEVTSDLDASTEARLVDDLFATMSGSTIVMIAHRLVSVMRCDRIFVLENGQIVEEGAHEDLVQRAGVYAEMWAMQQGGAPSGADAVRRAVGADAQWGTGAITYR